MKEQQDSTFNSRVQILLIVLLLAGLMLGTSKIFARESQLAAELNESVGDEENPNIDSLYRAWKLAVRYKYEEIPDNYDINKDPKMREIWSLRGDHLRYFLDSIEAINRVQTIMFPPSSIPEQTQNMTLDKERELIQAVTVCIFSKELHTQGMEALNVREQAYIAELEMVLGAMVKGGGDRFFTPEYLEYRAAIMPFIEDTEMKLFSSSEEALDSYLQYFDIDDVRTARLSLNRPQVMSCTTTYTINNWPAKSSVFWGNTGSSWREAKSHDQSDCDIFVSYFMGSTPYYGRISANTSSAQCVLDNSPPLRGSWVGNFNNVQYGLITVTWPWPFGCNTTGNALRSATKWRL